MQFTGAQSVLNGRSGRLTRSGPRTLVSPTGSGASNAVEGRIGVNLWDQRRMESAGDRDTATKEPDGPTFGSGDRGRPERPKARGVNLWNPRNRRIPQMSWSYWRSLFGI